MQACPTSRARFSFQGTLAAPCLAWGRTSARTTRALGSFAPLLVAVSTSVSALSLHSVNSQRTVINTVPNAMRELGLESLDLLKVDVEGFEWEVFMGVDLPLNKHRIRMFTFEYGGTWVDKRASAPRSFYLLVRIADSAGYDCFIIASDDLYQVNGQFEFDHVVHPTHGNSGNILCVRRDEPMWCHVLSRVRQSMSHCVNEAPVCKAIAEKRGQRWPGPH